MRKYGFIILVTAAGIFMAGCGKKETPIQESAEPMSMETLTTAASPETTTTLIPESGSGLTSTRQAASGMATTPAKLEALPPSGPYKPSAEGIQTALKNANFYTGGIDGKIGPKTKKAIEEFQEANGLKVDGKVGPKTWAALSRHLSSGSN